MSSSSVIKVQVKKKSKPGAQQFNLPGDGDHSRYEQCPSSLLYYYCTQGDKVQEQGSVFPVRGSDESEPPVLESLPCKSAV